jgi:uncharacterized membrane protein YgcG
MAPLHELLHDQAGLLKLRERQQILRQLRRFRVKFPGCFLAVITTALSSGQDHRRAGLALMNDSSWSDVDHLHADAGLMLLIDIEKKQASIVLGYQREHDISEQEVSRILAQGQLHWHEGRYYAGISVAIAAIEKVLIRRHRRLQRIPQQATLLSWFGKLIAKGEKKGGER